ncbi:MAG: D-2-hydroxyacid dehydrogenase [Chloroflexi bacterium]|nr:D-2-hydroxyacid dehydrogenase [Chloroflexota bacterium]
MPKFVMMPPQTEQKREWARRLADTLPPYMVAVPETDEDARREIVDADAAFGWVPPAALKLARKLRWLQNPDAGPFPGYYYKELIEHPVVICNPRGIYSDHISVHIMMFLLALSRGLPFYMGAQARGQWEKDAPRFPFVYLREATAIIVGIGGIGAETARLCSEFGITVIGVDPRIKDAPGVAEMATPDRLDEFLPRADFLITTVPHTPETEGMFNMRRFRLMKKTACFINIGRGKTTRLDELTDAVANGVIAGCGLDVFETEPLPAGHRLWTLPNVLITPHVAVRDGVHVEERRFQIMLENARRFAEGRPLVNVVEKDKWY